MAGIESLDEQLDAAYHRRENCMDLLVQMLIQIDGATNRIDVLLDRKLDQASTR